MTTFSSNTQSHDLDRRLPSGSGQALVAFLIVFALFAMGLLAASEPRFADRAGPVPPAQSSFSDWHGNVARSGSLAK